MTSESEEFDTLAKWWEGRALTAGSPQEKHHCERMMHACRLASDSTRVVVPEERAIDEEALGRAAWELQRSFGREGSIYGIKACEEIARLAIATYLREPQHRSEPK